MVLAMIIVLFISNSKAMAKKNNHKPKRTQKNTHKPTAKKWNTTNKVQNEKQLGIHHLFIKLVLFVILVSGVVLFTDSKGYFTPDVRNNHTEKKWNSFYKFTKRNNVDVVLVGNSSLYTAINPKHLSCALGANSFVLASPGTTLSDAYYCLKEAISLSQPKIAVIETNTILNYDSHHLSPSQRSNQFKSFYARKNMVQKLASMPFLFNTKDYLAAWSNTIRNHTFIFSDRKQIEKNAKHKNEFSSKKKLYLGRYVRFTSGIEDSTLQKYNLPETPKEDGLNYKISPEARKYLKKTIELCKKNDVELVFLTVPIHKDLMVNYQEKKAKINKEIEGYNPFWLDLQDSYDTQDFRADCFENIASPSQHMTYTGSLVVSYKLANYIHKKLPNTLEDRSNDPKWLNMFHEEEGFIENYTPIISDSNKAKILFQNKRIKGIPNLIKEIDVLKNKKGSLLCLKMDKKGINLDGKSMQLLLVINDGTKTFLATVRLNLARGIDPLNHYLFVCNLKKGLEVLQIQGAVINK